MPRNPLTVHDPDPSGFTLCVWDCSCLTLPSRGSFTPWAGRAASQPPSSSGAPPSCFWYVWASGTWERRAHGAVLNLTFIRTSSKSVVCWSVQMRCHRVSWHAVLETKGQRKQEAGCPPPPPSNSALQVSLFPLCYLLPSPGWREEGIFGPLCRCLRRNTVFLLTAAKLLYAQPSRKDK